MKDEIDARKENNKKIVEIMQNDMLIQYVNKNIIKSFNEKIK